MPPIQLVVAVIGFGAAVLAAAYAALTIVAVLVWHLRKPGLAQQGLPPVTVLKPLCGSEPGLYEHLRSYCVQNHAQFQVIFGVRDPADPALDVARRLQAEMPQLDIEIVVSPQQHGSNRKMSNLINMVSRARHDVLLMADSDTRVDPDYLATVTAPLRRKDVGLVTCLYRGMPTPSVWSRLGAMYANQWYVPSVLLAGLFGYKEYAFGQTLALRRDTVEAIGGLQAIADYLADDYELGERVRRLGLKVELSPYMVEVQHHERDLAALVSHELRWMRTTRVLRPRSSCFMFISVPVPLASLGLLLAASAVPALAGAAWALWGIAAVSRLALHAAQRPAPRWPLLPDLWLLPLRDLLTCWVWGCSFFSYRVSWRGGEFDVRTDGVMQRRLS